MNTVNGASIKIPRHEEMGNIVADFNHLLHQFNSGIHSVDIKSSPYNTSNRVDMELRFMNEDMFNSFMYSTSKLHKRDKREEALHDEFPALRKAYEEYQTMVKLYGG